MKVSSFFRCSQKRAVSDGKAGMCIDILPTFALSKVENDWRQRGLLKIDRQSADCHHQPRCDSAAVLLKNTDFAVNADSIYLLIIKGRLKGGDVKQSESDGTSRDYFRKAVRRWRPGECRAGKGGRNRGGTADAG